LNVFKPLIIRNLLHSIRILSDSMNGFVEHLVDGLQADEERISKLLTERYVISLSYSQPHTVDSCANF
jgi:fumarate hydratase class II